MKNRKKLSSAQRRHAGYWMQIYYNKLMKKKPRGFITYGGGLNILAWISEAESQGYFCVMTNAGVELR